MTDTSKKWKKRVAAWRASGLNSTQFCAGRDFTAGGLRYWAHRLCRLEAEREDPPTPPIRLAHVVRSPSRTRSCIPVTEPKGTAAKGPEPSVVLETQGVRIGVSPGFDPATLASVLDVLEQRSLQPRAS